MRREERHLKAMQEMFCRYYFLYGLGSYWLSRNILPRVLPTTVATFQQPYPTDPDTHVLIHSVQYTSGSYVDSVYRFRPKVENGESLGQVLAKYCFTFNEYEMAYPEVTNIIIGRATLETEGFDPETLLRRYHYHGIELIVSKRNRSIRTVLEHFQPAEIPEGKTNPEENTSDA